MDKRVIPTTEIRIKNLREDKVIRDYIAKDKQFDGRYEMTNNDIYSNPYRKYYYQINFKNVQSNFYINNGIVSGIFENVSVSCDDNEYHHSFWDCSTFKNCTFINCEFQKLDIRWCTFDKCTFIGCTGTIRYISASTFKKNCIFENSDINIEQVDEYFYMNSKRHKNDDVKLCERAQTTE